MTEPAKTNYRSLILIGIILMVVASFAFYSYVPSSSQAGIRIGVLMPLTGDRAAYGVAMKDAIELARDEINRDGGLVGDKLELVTEDTKGTPRESINAFEKVTLKDGIDILIGPMSSAEVLAVAPNAEKRKVLLFTPSASSPDITNAGDYIFRNVPSDVYEGGAMASIAATELGLRKVAILQINSDYGYGVVKEFSKEFEKNGGTVELTEVYPDGARDFRTPLLRIKEAAPDAVLFVGYKEMGVAIAQAYEIGLNQQFLSTAIFEDPEIMDAAGKAAEGLIFTSITFDQNNPTPRAQSFSNAYKNKTGRSPDGYAASAYDAAHIVAEAIRLAGSAEPGQLKDALYKLPPFEGLIGTIEFNAQGDALLPIKLKRVKNGTFETFIP